MTFTGEVHKAPVYACCICGNTPALRKVGYRGFCKKHLAEATAARGEIATRLLTENTHENKYAYSGPRKTLTHVNKGKPARIK